MCIIVFDKRSATTTTVDKDILLRCQEKNQDGMGIMWGDGEKLHTFTTLNDFDAIYERYLEARAQKFKTALHFRIGTKGTVTQDNCHPFVIHDDLAFMHNGTMHDVFKASDLPEDWNDTRYVNENLFQTFPRHFLTLPSYHVILDTLLKGDRLLFMDQLGRSMIFNANTGFWLWGKVGEGVWFSHQRDRGFIVHGTRGHLPAQRKNWEGDRRSSGNSNASVKHSERRSSGHSSGSRVKKWFDHIERGEPSKKEMKSRKKKNTRKFSRANLIFCYGDDRDDIFGKQILPMDSLKCVGTGELHGAQLWAVDSPVDERFITAGLLPTNKDSGEPVVGTVYAIDTPVVDDVMEFLDGKMNHLDGQPDISLFHRFHMPVTMYRGGNTMEVYAWVYFVNPHPQITTLISEVKTNDWSDWYASGEDRDHSLFKENDKDVLETIDMSNIDVHDHPYPLVDTPAPNCPQCKGFDTELWCNPSISVVSVYCRDCQTESELERN